MTSSVTKPREPFLILPGFSPDAVGFALRTTIALLLAYLIAFWGEFDSASSAGVCVAIVAQSSPGMALSKAFYRVIGTILGGAVAIAIVSAFAQDRTMLLVSFTLWLGLCSFVAALLRDFRSYGAVLCGYTVGIIAVSNIDAPQHVLLVTLDRVAAILLGVGCVALVNTTLVRSGAFETLVSGLHQAMARMQTVGKGIMTGAPASDPATTVKDATDMLALTPLVTYTTAELPDGRGRALGARSAIAGLLSMLSASEGVAIGQTQWADPHRPVLDTPLDAYVAERTAEWNRALHQAETGLKALENGGAPVPAVRISRHYDVVGAGLSALRTMIAVGLGAVFCVLSGWSGTAAMLVQQAAFTALLGMQANPSAAAAVFGYSLPLPALAAGIIGYVLLPGVSGFVPFGVAIAPCIFVFALMGHHPRTAALGPGLMLYFCLLLAPSNPETYDLAAYVNNCALQVVAILFMVLAFRLILPVSRKRRLYRIAKAIRHDLRQSLRHGRDFEPAPRQSLKYDRLVTAQQWIGRPTPARMAVFARLHAFSELDTALRRAWAGLDAAQAAMQATTSGLVALLASARTALMHHEPNAIEVAAIALLAHPEARRPDIISAVSGMYGAHVLLAREARALLHYRIVEH